MSLNRFIFLSIINVLILSILFISFTIFIRPRSYESFVMEEFNLANHTFEETNVITEKEKLTEIKAMLERLEFDGIYDMAGTPDYRFFFRNDEQVYSAWRHQSPKLTIVNSSSGGTTIDITDPFYSFITSEEDSELAQTKLALAEYFFNRISSAFNQAKTESKEENYTTLYYTLVNSQNKVEKEIEKHESVIDVDIWASYLDRPNHTESIVFIEQIASNIDAMNLEDLKNLTQIEKLWIEFEKDIYQLVTEEDFHPTSLTKQYTRFLQQLNELDEMLLEENSKD